MTPLTLFPSPILSWVKEWVALGATELSCELTAEVKSRPWLIIKDMPKVNRGGAVKQIDCEELPCLLQNHITSLGRSRSRPLMLFSDLVLFVMSHCSLWKLLKSSQHWANWVISWLFLLSFHSAVIGNAWFPLPSHLQLMVSSLLTQFGLINNSQPGFCNWKQKGHQPSHQTIMLLTPSLHQTLLSWPLQPGRTGGWGTGFGQQNLSFQHLLQCLGGS